MRGLTISAHGGLDQIEYRTDLPKPEPKRGEIRVRVKAAALNHLDLFVVAGMPGVKITPPWILGADATGIVDAIGDLSGTSDNQLKVGDSVIVNPGLSDHTCEFCLAGEHSLCVNFKLLGEHAPGTLAEYIVIPARNAREIPKGKPVEQAAAFTLSTLTAMALTPRLSKSLLRLAVRPSSVVHTGVKSLGCENRMAQLPPSHWWK